MLKMITDSWLKKHNACVDGHRWFRDQDETDSIVVLKKLIKEAKYDWAIWLFAHLATKDQNVRFAIYCAEQSLRNFEDRYPNDKRPRKAVAAARRYRKNPTEANKAAARSAEDAAWSAVRSAAEAAWSARSARFAARFAARSAAEAAWSAEAAVRSARFAARFAARSAEDAAWSAAWSAKAAWSAAWSAAWAAKAAWSADGGEQYKRICNYGVRVLREGA